MSWKECYADHIVTAAEAVGLPAVRMYSGALNK